MKKLAFVVIYLLGFFSHYVYFRNNIKSHFGTYTHGDRNFNIAISSMSWLGLGLDIIAWNMFLSKLDKNEAKW